MKKNPNIIVAVVLLLLIMGAIAYMLFQKPAPPKAAVSKKSPQKKTKSVGQQVSDALWGDKTAMDTSGNIKAGMQVVANENVDAVIVTKETSTTFIGGSTTTWTPVADNGVTFGNDVGYQTKHFNIGDDMGVVVDFKYGEGNADDEAIVQYKGVYYSVSIYNIEEK
jgi:hypothetical protein